MVADEMFSPFEDLPAELINYILQFLTSPSRLTARLVCRRWSALACLGMKFLIQVNDETLQAAMRCNLRADILYARDLKQPLPLSYRRKVINNVTYLRRMFFGPNITAGNMKKLLEQVQHVDTLGFSYEQPPSFAGLQFRNLTCLQFQKLKLEKTESVAFKRLLSNMEFPCLKRFNVILIDASEYRVYLAIHLFVVNHAKTLKNVIINIAPEKLKTAGVEERFQNLYEKCETYRDILRRMSSVKLETIWINACNYEGLSPWNLSCKLVESQDSLECLLLDGVWLCKAIQESGALNIPEILEKNQETLKRLKLPVTDLDGRILARCKDLKELGVFVQHDHLKTFGLPSWDGHLRSVQFLPRSLRMMDLHICLRREDAVWILTHIPLDDYVCEGRREQRWKWETFMELWSCPTLTKFRSYTTMSEIDAGRIHEFILVTPGIRGNIEYNVRKRFAVTDVTFDRHIFGRTLTS